MPANKLCQSIPPPGGSRQAQHIPAVEAGDGLGESPGRAAVALINDDMAEVILEAPGNGIDAVDDSDRDPLPDLSFCRFR